ncbi:hypothetical protein CP082626L3_0606B, partial [Chlamydia psittaci 08-2626_L3]
FFHKVWQKLKLR